MTRLPMPMSVDRDVSTISGAHSRSKRVSIFGLDAARAQYILTAFFAAK